MLTIDSYDLDFIDVTKLSEFDNTGMPSVGVKLQAGPWKLSIESRLIALEQKEIHAEQLRREHPGLNELYEKYKMMEIIYKK